ncbi:MAG: hypothetical protein Fues2KO_04310 [Fuerstiella sp.]
MTSATATTEETCQQRFHADPANGRDELNLAEFPLALLSDRAPPGCNSLHYRDSVFDQSRGKYVERSLVVSAPEEYGLPTAKDEEVLLALIHLTERVNGFENPTVHFSRYELIKLLDWNTGAKSYRRIRESLTRWKSVTVDYRNAWRRNNCWVSEVFSLIDNVTICEAEELRATRKGRTQADLPLSSFTWNRVLFESLQARHIKRIDFEFYQKLKTATAKRLFRFLDKRFGTGRDHWEFNLQDFAFQHIGISRSYHTGKIKEKLQPAISELEARGYLVPRTKEERYRKYGSDWRVSFTRPSRQLCSGATLVKELVEHGVSRAKAEQLCRDHQEEEIRQQIDVYEWIMEHEPESLKNPAGYLAESIRQGFQPPARHQTKEQRAAVEQLRSDRNRVQAEQLRTEQEQRERLVNERQHLQSVRESLTDAELKQLEEQALRQADETQRQALSSPQSRELQLLLLVDELILKRFPFEAPVAAT